VFQAKISEMYLAACPCHLSPVQLAILVEYLIEKRAVILNKNIVIAMFYVPEYGYSIHIISVLGQILPFLKTTQSV